MRSKYFFISFLLVLTACSHPNSGNEGQSVTTSQSPQPTATAAAAASTSAPANPSVQTTVPAPTPQPSSPASKAEAPKDSSATLRPDHVVIVVEENHSYEKIIGNASAPYMNALAGRGAFFTQSYAVTHPSQPNYLVLFSGSNQGVKDDSCGHTFKAPNLASELLSAGYTFGGYSEDLPSVGSTACTHKQYGRKHSPWVNFTNVPKEANMPLESFPSDYSKLPTVSFVIPNMDHDMHDGTIQSADEWLKKHMGSYIDWAQSHNSLFILTWDEDDSSKDNHIPTIFVGPMVKAAHYDQRITHSNVLRTLEDLYKLPYTGSAEDVASIQAIWKS
ncbi:alkaline phosphatase family protein [Paenibacillus sp. GCM10027628]|uniref:alkaline phosphatase family protein n=1 Tax=Paenibacillus sp. GCM10027628 TaxID=3273413 RepID=UPI0036254AA0